MRTTARVSVGTIAEALELDTLPEGFEGSDDIDIEVDVDDDEMAEEFKEEPQDLSDIMDKADVMDLAAAVRRGDRAEAELLLDRLFSVDDKAAEWIQIGRFSPKARKTERQALAKAA